MAGEILGMDLKGFIVKEVLVEEKLDIDREFYVGMIIDDAKNCPVLIFSSKGAAGIEEIAKKFSEQVAKRSVDISRGLKGYEAYQFERS